MFGKRTSLNPVVRSTAAESAYSPGSALENVTRSASDLFAVKPTIPAPQASAAASAPERNENDNIKTMLFNALIETIDLSRLAQLDPQAGREEIRHILNEIINLKNVVMSVGEQEQLLTDICNDVLGYGPLEPLLARDDISDSMVNGASRVFIEVGGRVQRRRIRFRATQQSLYMGQRIVSQGRRRVSDST